MTVGALSRYILWEYPSLSTAINQYVQRFNFKQVLGYTINHTRDDTSNNFIISIDYVVEEVENLRREQHFIRGNGSSE